MIKIKLRDEAPWKKVTLLDGTIVYKGKFVKVSDDTNYIAFKKWVVIQEIDS